MALTEFQPSQIDSRPRIIGIDIDNLLEGVYRGFAVASGLLDSCQAGERINILGVQLKCVRDVIEGRV